MNLVLIGYRGTGKSRVAALLGQRLAMPCIVMDREIEARAGMTTPELVAQHGWKRFRELESEVARDLSARDGIIIDTGGGVVERPENVAVLCSNGRIVWLKATVETIVSRIQSGTHRPSLVEGKTFTEEVAEVLARRLPTYQSAADFEIDTDGLIPEEIAETVADYWLRQPR